MQHDDRRMFLAFHHALREAGLPVSIREYLELLAAARSGVADASVERFYFLARAALVKDERFYDRFDRVFSNVFKGLEGNSLVPEPRPLPEEWLRILAEDHLTDEDRRALEALGWERLMDTLRERLAEQKERHEGGDKWIGTLGRSPFGALGAHPEGVRIGQGSGRNKSAVKVWDRREFKDLDEDEALGPRNLKLALRRLRKFARTGAADELDLDATIRGTATKAYLDLHLRPERRNAIKLLLFLDIGGSMDWHIGQAQQLFAAAKAEFKHLQHFYFHNCLYEGAWKTNARRFVDRTPTLDIINTFPRDTKVAFVGDASMSPYEISMPGGAVEYTNGEAGAVWMERVTRAYPRCVWLNPVAERDWPQTESIQMVRALMSGRMFPLTLAGLDAAVKELSH
jgi:uncharacterized protein with von Willebrand factor type A (vWA) domain